MSSSDWQDVVDRAIELRDALLARGWMVGCAESCTGGLVSAAMTSIAGSSEWFERGFVTYSNRAKREMLGVPDSVLDRHGAVSREVAIAMSLGVLARAPVNAALAITGIAGPTGGTAEKPVGLVWFGWAWEDASGIRSDAESMIWPGDRQAVRLASVRHALAGLLARLGT